MSAFQPQPNQLQAPDPHAFQKQESTLPAHSTPATGGGRFDFDDGGVYVGGWLDGRAHGHGICTGPKGQGEYSGSFHYGFEVCGVYKWPSGAIYEGQWLNGKRHGIGVEYRGKWVYKGEWTQGYKGRYGVRASLLSAAKYEGTWANGLQDGYGSETYADSGTYQGQWQRGMRHGYGVRQSAPYGHCHVTKQALSKSAHTVSIQSLDTEGEGSGMDQKRDSTMRGGFVLVAHFSGASSSSSRRRNSLVERSSQFKHSVLKSLRLKKQKSTGDIDVKSSRSNHSVASSTDSNLSMPLSGKSTGNATEPHASDLETYDAVSNASFLSQDADIHDPSTTETYMGEWKNDKRCGFGISERSDGLRYEGEWYNNKKYGYGVTVFCDGSREEGKYKNNVLVTNAKKKHLFVIRSSKLRDRIESAVQAARQAQQIALQKADIAISRTATARGRAEQSDVVAAQARAEFTLAYKMAKQYDGTDLGIQPDVPMRRRLSEFGRRNTRELFAQTGGATGVSATSGVVTSTGGIGMNPTSQPQSVTTSTTIGGSQNPPNRQFLDSNEPFGGRRGSFRSTNATSSTAFPSSGHSSSSSSYPSYHHQQTQYSPSAGSGYQGTNLTINKTLPSYSTNSSSFRHPIGGGGPGMSGYHQPYGHDNPPPPPPPLQPQDPLDDHLDHYQKLVARYAPTRRPTNDSLNRQQNQRFGASTPESYLPSSTANPHHSQHPHQKTPPPSSSISSSASFYRTSTSSNEALITSLNKMCEQGTPDSGVGSQDESLSSAMNASVRSGLQLPPVIDMSQSSTGSIGKGLTRTASLYRLPVYSVAGGSSGKSSVGGTRVSAVGGGVLKRKPSLQPSLVKQLEKPVMTREEVSALSHAQREQRRLEAEMSEKMARNPFLYFLSPRFRDWLSRRKIIISVLVINITLAILFFKLLG